MGKAPTWSKEESAALAQSWLETSEDDGSPDVKGTNQESSVFWKSVVERFQAKAPDDRPQGTYHARGDKPIVTHWKDNIARDVKKFNKCLLKVLASKPTGVGEQEKINMAAAIHLGKIDAVSYRHRSFEPNDWKFYQCWLVLKDHRAFKPPQAPTADSVVVVEETNSDENLDDTEPTDFADDAAVDDSLFNNSTKKATALEEYRKRKQSNMSDLLSVQQSRQETFQMFVNNQSRAQAFNMAKDMMDVYAKAGNDEKAAEYAEKMEKIMSLHT